MSNQTTPTTLTHWLILGLMGLGFFAFWNWDLGYPALSGDEAFVAIMAEQPASQIMVRLNADEPHPPVYYLFRRGWRLLLGGHHEFIDRYPSVLMGLLLLSLIYRLGRDLGLGPWGAMAAVAAAGLNPHLTAHLREARMYGPMLLTVTLAVCVAWRFERLPRRAAIGLAAGVSLLALMTHYFSAFFIGALGLWGLIVFKGATRWRWVAAQALAFLVLAVWLPLLGRGFFNPTSLSTGKTWSAILPPWESLSRLVNVGAFGYRDAPTGGLALLGGGLLVGGWLLGSLARERRQKLLLLMLVVVPLVSYALLSWIKPVFHPKYTLPWLVFALLGTGALVTRWHWAKGGLWVLLIAMMIGPTWQTVRRPYDTGLTVGRDSWLDPIPRETSQMVTTLAGPTDAFGLGTPDATHCYYMDYYFDHSLGCNLLPLYPGQTTAEASAQLADIFTTHRVLWYLDFYNPAWDPQHVADAALSQTGLALGSEELAGRKLRLFTQPATVLNQYQPVGARLGDVAELQGVWWMRGRGLHLVLIWRSLADHPAVDAKVFVHWLDADGQTLTQDDSVPVEWTRPLNSWQQDEVLLDVHSLFPPEGVDPAGGTLEVGLYIPDTAQRLPAYDSSGARLPDDQVLVQPDW